MSMMIIHGEDRKHLMESVPLLGVVYVVGLFAAALMVIMILGITFA